jgi:hypothetical protein
MFKDVGVALGVAELTLSHFQAHQRERSEDLASCFSTVAPGT